MADGNSDAGVIVLFSGLGIMIMGLLAYTVIQIYLLAVSSQSIGKYS